MTTDSRSVDRSDKDGSGSDDSSGRGGSTEVMLGPTEEQQRGLVDDIAALELHDPTQDTGVQHARELRTFWRWAVFLVALTLSMFHLWTAFTHLLPSLQQRGVHLALGLGLVFLLFPAKTRRKDVTPGRFYGATMAFSGLLVAYIAAGGLSGRNLLFLPQLAVVAGTLTPLAGIAFLAYRRRGRSDGPSRAQTAAGWTLLAGTALAAMDLVTTNTFGSYFFLPVGAVVLLPAAIVLTYLLLCLPERLPGRLWNYITQWGLVATGVGMLAYMAVTGVAGWHVLGPAMLILALVQASRYLPVRIFGMPAFDIVLAALGMFAGLYVFVNYVDITSRPGLIDPMHVMAGTIAVLLIMVAASRVLGPALVVLTGALIAFAYFGQSMPGFLRHRGASVDRIVTDLYTTTEGIFGTPLGISATFIFLFMIFAAMLQRTGMERFFTDLALGATGSSTGGTAKVGVVTSAFSGTITGSSVANTVSNGAFTIPMMKKSGYKPEYAGAVEAASSTGGQIAPPIMGAGAFIMIEMTGASYQQILVAAIVPAILFFVSQFVVIHYDSKKLGIGGMPRHLLPNVRKLMLAKGYLLAPVIAIFGLLSMGYSPMPAALGAISVAVGINLLAQFISMPWRLEHGTLRARPVRDAVADAFRLSLPIIVAALGAAVVVWVIQTLAAGLGRGRITLAIAVGLAVVGVVVMGVFRRWERSAPDKLNLHGFLDGLVGAARLAVPIIVATAAAGIIAGLVQTTTALAPRLARGLVGLAQGMMDAIASMITWVATSPLLAWAGATAAVGDNVADTLRLDLILILFMSMLACLILGIGLPTTANYVVTATLAAPAIIAVLQADVDTRTLSMLLMAHLFVYYFGVMADITPPVCLAAYAASGISGGEPIKTGFYAVRIAVAGFVMPFMFVLSPELLLQEVTWISGTIAAVTAMIGASFVGVGVVGFITSSLSVLPRLALVVSGLLLLHGTWESDIIGLVIGVPIFVQNYRNERLRTSVPRAAPSGTSAAR